jgi:hypothetical protein
MLAISKTFDFDEIGWPEPDADALGFISQMHDRSEKKRWRVGAQMWGTELRRNQCPTYWTDQTEAKIQKFRDESTYVACFITDNRFKNEGSFCEEKGYTLLRLNRPGHITGNADHISETDLDDYPFNHIITNDGTIEEFKFKAIEWYKNLISTSPYVSSSIDDGS